MVTLKKSLGQHFLKDEKIIQQILSTLLEDPFDRLLEVGPGGGALTRHLLKLKNIELKAVELDIEKVNFLIQQYPALKDKIIRADFLVIEKPFENNFTVIGNFPYNISTQILFKILEWKEDVQVVIGMFQKEVAQRVAAPPGNRTYGVISVLIQAYYDIEYLFDVSPGCFIPPPNVISGVIRLKRRTVPLHTRSDRDFVLLVKQSFGQRRKMLRNAVKSLFTEEVLADPFFNQRAERLSTHDFAALTYKMK